MASKLSTARCPARAPEPHELTDSERALLRTAFALLRGHTVAEAKSGSWRPSELTQAIASIDALDEKLGGPLQ